MLKVYLENPWEEFLTQKTLFGFPENLYGCFFQF
jgi:hypothetical protein